MMLKLTSLKFLYKLRSTCLVIFCFLTVVLLISETSTAFSPTSPKSEIVGSGDGKIHIIPTLSSPSVKNGQKVSISAVVKAEAGVHQVTADIGGIDIIQLKPADSKLAGTNDLKAMGLWSGEWIARHLEEKIYTVTVRVTDNNGHVFEDRSLQFSDPVVGITIPGSTNYPNVGLRRLGVEYLRDEWDFRCAVIDTAAGYAYFATYTTNATNCARIVKVALGTGSNPPTRVNALTLNPGEDKLACAVIDTTNGYAYFGIDRSPGRVIKVALGAGTNPPRRIGSLTLSSGEDGLCCAVIDTTNGYAYFGTYTSPGRVIKVALGSGDALPTRVGAVTFNSGENNLTSAVIDAGNGYAYFGTWTSPGRVVKIALGAGGSSPTRIGAVTLQSAEKYLVSAVIDTANQYAYFGTRTLPGIVVKVALGTGSNPPMRAGAVSLVSGENHLHCAVIDAANGYAYFGTADTSVPSPGPPEVIKIRLGTGSNPPTRVGSISVGPSPPAGQGGFWCAVVDTTNGYAYFGAGYPSLVAKVALGAGDDLPTHVGSAEFEWLEVHLVSAVIDPVNDYAYFGANTAPGRLIKVALRGPGKPPERVGCLILNSGEDHPRCAVIDPGNGYAYLGTSGVPGRVVKVALGEGDSLPTRIGAVTLNASPAPGESGLESAVIDTDNGYAYFGTTTSPARVVKVKLGQGGAAPTRIGAVILETNENNLRCAVIDTENGYAYFGTTTFPGRVVKINLGTGEDPPTRVGAVTLITGEDELRCAVIDPTNGYAYFGTDTSPGKVVKILLGEGSNPPLRVTARALNSGENGLRVALIDPPNGYAYFGTSGYPSEVVKVALGAGLATPTRKGAVSLQTGEDNTRCAGIDTTDGYLYFGTYTYPGRIAKFSYSQKDYIKGTEVTLAEQARINDVRFYSHAAVGNVRVGIYVEGSKNLVWESSSVANTADDDWLIVSISSGTPTSLIIDPDTYWLAWQIDSTAEIPSYTSGSSGEGFSYTYRYNAFDPTIEDSASSFTSTSEKWSMYLTYDPTVPTISSHPASQTVNPGAQVNFSVEANGVGPLSYQWKKDGADLSNGGRISGADTATLTISSVQESDEGNYSCEVSNTYGSVESNAATLTVNDPPVVTSVVVQSTLTVDLTFSKPMGVGVTVPGNYTVSGSGKGTLADHPDSVILVSGNTYRLTWSSGEMFDGGDINVTVDASVQDTDGISMGSPNSGTHTGGGMGTPPTVVSCICQDASPTNGTTVDFTVTFSESVTGVDASDFSIAASGVSGASITNVVAGSPVWIVTVDTGSGDGTLSIDLIDDDSIVDAAGHPLGGAGTGNGSYTTGETYSIDKTPPTCSAPTDTGDYSTTTTVTFTWPAGNDPGSNPSGISHYRLYVGTVPGSGDVFDANVGNVLSKSITGSDGQTLYAQIRAIDNAGNSGALSGISDGIMIDITAPDTTATGPSGVLNQPNPVVSVTYSAIETGSGVQAVRLFYRKDGAGGFQQYGGDFSGSPIFFDTSTTGNNGTYEFYTIGIDNAGNVENAPSSSDVIVTFTNTTRVEDWYMF